MTEPDLQHDGSDKKGRLVPELILFACFILGIFLAWIGLAGRIPAALVSALVLGSLSLVMSDVVWTLDYRKTRLEATDEDTIKEIRREEEQYEKVHRALLFMTGSLALIILTIWTVLVTPVPSPDWSRWAFTALGLNLLIGVALWLIRSRVDSGIKQIDMRADSVAGWFTVSACLLLASVPAYMASTIADTESWIVYLFWFHRVAGIVLTIIEIELLIRSSYALISRSSALLAVIPAPSMVISTVIKSGGLSLLKGVDARTAKVDVENRFQWVLEFLQKSLPRVLTGLLVILWLSTAITQVGINEQGLRERFGAFTGRVLEPGIHLGWPWPIDKVVRYPSRKLQVMNVGFTTESLDSLSDLIWTESHGISEDRFVTASGSEVISFDIELFYRIDDITEYAYSYGNPAVLLKDIAYKAVMLRTNNTDTDTLLGRDRAALADSLKQDIQAGCNLEEIGLEITQVVIVAIHPPFEVADSYQAVVSAQVYRDTLSIQASSYMEEILPSAHADAQQMIDEAGIYASERVATATGEASGFVALSDAVSPEYDLYKFRRRIEALETGLVAKRLFIVTSDLIISETGEDRGLWFDLR